MYNFKQKTLLITGAAGHLGRTMAKHLGDMQAHLLLVDKNAEGLHQLKNDLELQGIESSIFAVNLESEADRASFIQSMLQDNIGVHGIINNAAFVGEFLATENIPIVAEDLLDVYPRKVYFFPASGKVMVKKLKNVHNNTIVDREKDYSSRLRYQPVAGDVELFG